MNVEPRRKNVEEWTHCSFAHEGSRIFTKNYGSVAKKITPRFSIILPKIILPILSLSAPCVIHYANSASVSIRG